MPILFCNVAWMKEYSGRNPEDPPLGGGGFPLMNGYCHEECNFLPCQDGFVYGHFETIKGELDRQVVIERLGARKGAEFIDGVDIVWTAPIEGKDPRTVVGWFRNARLFRRRQIFDGHFPSEQHRKDRITSFRVKALASDAFLFPVSQRTMTLDRGAGWSGQASWWYADDTTEPSAIQFVTAVKGMMNVAQLSQFSPPEPRPRSNKRPAGPATSEPYQRYVSKYEVQVHPRHHRLQQRFTRFLKALDPDAGFPKCWCDDLRYAVNGEPEVMVEIKPTDPATVRFAIRTAIGQLLDYKQNQKWLGRQLILVESPVVDALDRALAFENGFGLAWPESETEFQIHWPA